MANRKRTTNKRGAGKNQGVARPHNIVEQRPQTEDYSDLERIPTAYQEITDFFKSLGKANPFPLRKETYRRIQDLTGRPIICYVAKTHHLTINIPGISGTPDIPASIDNSDLTGFADLVRNIEGENVDVFIVSNGGSAEATERIVRLLRDSFKSVRFIVPANAFSAATLMCFSGDEIIMDPIATFGPIDPQINGVPARAILRGFESALQKLKDEGPHALTAYMPLISKYDLSILEICKSAQELSTELSRNFLSSYMLKCSEEDPRIGTIVDFFSDYDLQKSHGRSIGRAKCRELGLMSSTRRT